MKVVVLTAVWCHACLFMKKTFKTFEQNHPEWSFQFLDVDLDAEAECYSLGKVLPVLIFLKDGQEVHRIQGEKTLDDLERESNHAF